jgi:hypothetical protein
MTTMNTKKVLIFRIVRMRLIVNGVPDTTSAMKRVLLPFVLGLVSISFIATANPGQPNMEAALGDLRAARASLQKAVPDKQGHRDKAIGLVDQAIAQVQAGMAAAR